MIQGGGTEILSRTDRTDRHTDRQTHRSTYRGGAHLKSNLCPPCPSCVVCHTTSLSGHLRAQKMIVLIMNSS